MQCGLPGGRRRNGRVTWRCAVSAGSERGPGSREHTLRPRGCPRVALTLLRRDFRPSPSGNRLASGQPWPALGRRSTWDWMQWGSRQAPCAAPSSTGFVRDALTEAARIHGSAIDRCRRQCDIDADPTVRSAPNRGGARAARLGPRTGHSRADLRHPAPGRRGPRTSRRRTNSDEGERIRPELAFHGEACPARHVRGRDCAGGGAIASPHSLGNPGRIPLLNLRHVSQLCRAAQDRRQGGTVFRAGRDRARNPRPFRPARIEAGARVEADAEDSRSEVPERGGAIPSSKIGIRARRPLESGDGGGRRARPVLGPHDPPVHHQVPDGPRVRGGAHALPPGRRHEPGGHPAAADPGRRAAGVVGATGRREAATVGTRGRESKPRDGTRERSPGTARSVEECRTKPGRLRPALSSRARDAGALVRSPIRH